MNVRKSAPADAPELCRLSRLMFGSDRCFDPWDDQIFVIDRCDGRLGGYMVVSQRCPAAGSDAGQVAHIEAWYVDQDLRSQGLGRKLLDAASHWAGIMGLMEICSNVELGNQASMAAHHRMGFIPTVQLQFFRKPLGQAASRVASQGYRRAS